MLKNKKVLSVIMIIVSGYLSVDYFLLIMEGDDTIRRKFAFAVWTITFIAWMVILVKTLLNERKNKDSETV